MNRTTISTLVAGACCALAAHDASAANFNFDDGVTAAWVTSVTAGFGMRTKSASCMLVGDASAAGCGGSVNTAQWANGDNGDLNYRKGQLFTGYVSAVSELLVTAPGAGMKFLARGTALYDAAADHTQRTALSDDAKVQIVTEVKWLDLWAQKDFRIADQAASLRVGNQVINWGESTFASGGINATNSLDWQKLLIPGTQLKQALLPAPMLTLTSDVAPGWSTQAYLQFKWNANRYAPVGGYWSVTDLYGRGSQPAWYDNANFNQSGAEDSADSTAYGYGTVKPKNRLQGGLRVNWKPESLGASFSAYYLNYIDKSPVLTYLASGDGQWSFLKNRALWGASTNFTLGDWAIGAEASFRPRDAVSLSSCYLPGGTTDANTNGAYGLDCPAWMDRKKTQLDATAQKYFTQSGSPWLGLVGADQATFTAEATWIHYSGVSASHEYGRDIGGTPVYQTVEAAYGYWLRDDATLGTIGAPKGTSDSMGIALDFNATYDGSLVPGWAITPGVTFYGSLRGYTPSFSANYEQGARSANFYVLFNQNPAVWQAGLNYSAYWGGNAISQPYGDRNFVGGFVTRNF
jgi:hypothetical protein